MKELTILFIGLISHFAIHKPAVDRRAVFITSHHHDAVMVVLNPLPQPDELKEFLGGSGVERTFSDFAGWVEFDIARRHLAFHLPAGQTSVDPSIPKLTEITDGDDPLPKIAGAMFHVRTRAFVDYTGGTLMPFAGFTYPIQWQTPNPRMFGCKPSAIGKPGTATPLLVYKTSLSDADDEPYIEDKDSGKRLHLNKDGFVLFGNVPPIDEAHGPHYKDYLWTIEDGNCICEMGGITRNRTRVTALAPQITGQAHLSPLLQIILGSIRNPECTNTQYP